MHRFFLDLYRSAAEPLPHHIDSAALDDQDCTALVQAEDASWCNSLAGNAPPVDFQAELAASAGLRVRYIGHCRVHDLCWQYLAWNEEVSGVTGVHRPPASWGTFWGVWVSRWSGVICLRKKSNHAMCSTCFRLQEELKRCGSGLAEKLEAARRLRAHIRDQYADRMIYWALRFASQRPDSEVLTIIIDSMDKTKFAIPRWKFSRKPKFLDNLVRPRMVCTGAIAHGWCTSVYLSDEVVGHGANAFCEVLLLTLEKVFRMSRASGRTLPKHLVVLSDNTTSQAKNACAANLMALLVSRYKFLTTNLLFLRVGHTHEDIGIWPGFLASKERPSFAACAEQQQVASWQPPELS